MKLGETYQLTLHTDHLQGFAREALDAGRRVVAKVDHFVVWFTYPDGRDAGFELRPHLRLDEEGYAVWYGDRRARTYRLVEA